MISDPRPRPLVSCTLTALGRGNMDEAEASDDSDDDDDDVDEVGLIGGDCGIASAANDVIIVVAAKPFAGGNHSMMPLHMTVWLEFFVCAIFVCGGLWVVVCAV